VSEFGATAIALGRRRDGIPRTVRTNLFRGSRLEGLPPRLVRDAGCRVLTWAPLDLHVTLRARNRPEFDAGIR